tara:strand:- start:1081 stop:1836 length:756 start_codon:yes stop_codon:yes gene_type:complete
LKKIAQKYQILLFFFLLSGCISISDVVGTDESEAEPVDEVGQLLSDIQEEDANSILSELNEEPSLEISEEKLDASPTQEYDSVLLDQSSEEESNIVAAEQPAVETSQNEKIEVDTSLQNFESSLPKLSITDKIQYRVATINFYSGSSQVDGSGLRKIKKIAKIAKEREARIKIVGHASKRTRDMPLAKHKLVNFNISDRRAQSVADIFIKKHNFPSNNLITEAVSDTKPLFKENMPAGTKANQRTEIFIIY